MARKSCRKPLTREKRPLVRLAQPVKVVQKEAIPVDPLRKTKVYLVGKKVGDHRVSKRDDATIDEFLAHNRAQNSTHTSAIPLYNRSEIRRIVHDNIGTPEIGHGDAEVVHSRPCFRTQARLAE